jgi:hypothetical protein
MKTDKKTISTSYRSLPARNKFCSHFNGGICFKNRTMSPQLAQQRKKEGNLTFFSPLGKQNEFMKENWAIILPSPARKEEGGGFYYPRAAVEKWLGMGIIWGETRN